MGGYSSSGNPSALDQLELNFLVLLQFRASACEGAAMELREAISAPAVWLHLPWGVPFHSSRTVPWEAADSQIQHDAETDSAEDGGNRRQ